MTKSPSPSVDEVAEPLPGKYDAVLKPFVTMMEAELHVNSGKGDRPGWLAMSREEVLLEIYYHLAKLQKAVRKGEPDGIREYAADVANMSMMAVDICGAWPSPASLVSPPKAVAGEPVAWRSLEGGVSLSSKPFPGAHPLYANHEARGDGVREPTAFQARVADAHVALFHDDPTDIPERRDRFYEEATEAVQALGMTEDDAHKLVSYTFSRPPGDVRKEIGAAALTLASLCVTGGWDMMECAEADLAALRTPEKIAKVRAKRATRHGRGPLPGHDPAALEAALPPLGDGRAEIVEECAKAAVDAIHAAPIVIHGGPFALGKIVRDAIRSLSNHGGGLS